MKDKATILASNFSLSETVKPVKHQLHAAFSDNDPYGMAHLAVEDLTDLLYAMAVKIDELERRASLGTRLR